MDAKAFARVKSTFAAFHYLALSISHRPPPTRLIFPLSSYFPVTFRQRNGVMLFVVNQSLCEHLQIGYTSQKGQRSTITPSEPVSMTRDLTPLNYVGLGLLGFLRESLFYKQ
jgi:hypothetical protein